ncbi:MAG TPA: cupin domain-containing protein [Alphaproteobacteria bacterium]|jgi:uncharacterized cupin superfamily protein
MSKTPPKSAALDPKTIEGRRGTLYPDKFKPRVAGREKRTLGNALGLTNFGVNLVKLEPSAQSALRHWHSQQDEFVWVVEGEVTLVTDAGPQTLRAGMCAGFPKGNPDGHHLVNKSSKDAWYLEVGDRSAGDAVVYPDDAMGATFVATYKFTKPDGSPL